LQDNDGHLWYESQETGSYKSAESGFERFKL